MDDEMLREFVLNIERNESACPVTLMLSSATHCGVAVSRSTFLRSLEDVAVAAGRVHLKQVARLLMDREEEEAGAFVNLIDAFVISGGQRLSLVLTSEDGRRAITERTPARVRDVQSWQPAFPFEAADRDGA
jgi:hypothetical protein